MSAQPRAFTLGNVGVMLIGCVLLGAVYPYLILKTGYVPGLNVVSGLLTFILLKALLRREHIDARESNLIQTAMTTAANVGFMAVVVAALGMLGIVVSPIIMFLWLCAGAGLGTLMVVPLRRLLIDEEQLAFPHGKATGELLKTLEDPTGPGLRKAHALSYAGLFAAAVAVLRDGFRLIPPSFANAYKVGAEPSLMLMGAGALVGVRTALWLLISSLLTWGVFAPMLVHSGIAQDTARAFGMQNDLAKGAYYSVLMRWTMWPATMILLANGLTIVLMKWRSLLESFRAFFAVVKGGAPEQQDMPFKPVVAGIVVLTAVMCVVQSIGFGISPFMTVLAVLISFPLMLVGVRVKGETGIGPISILASLMQLLFGVIAPGNISANMATSGTTASVVNSADDLMDDMKTAKVVGNVPQSLTMVQFLVGIPMGALMTTLVYPLLVRSYGFGENGLAAPTARKWQGLALLLKQGWGSLPPYSNVAMVVAIVVGILLAVFEKRWPKWTPSAMGIGMAMLLPAQTVVPMAVGGIGAWVFSHFWAKKSALFLVPTAAGFLAGEATASLIISLIRVLWG